jgi:hypothetical protein
MAKQVSKGIGILPTKKHPPPTRTGVEQQVLGFLRISAASLCPGKSQRRFALS